MSSPSVLPSLGPICLALFASTATAQATLELPEPNGTAATASPATPGLQAYGLLSAGTDVDCWSFTLAETSDVRIYVTTRGSRGTSVGGSSLEDSRATLYDTDGATVLAANDDYSGRSPGKAGRMSKLVAYGLQPGTYFVEVAAWSLAGWGDYGLDILANPAGPAPIFCSEFAALTQIFELEPNGDVGSASPIPCCAEVFGTIEVPGDEDYCAITLGSDTIVDLAVSSDNSLFYPLTDSQIYVFGPDGATVFGVDEDDGPGFMSQLQVFLEAGTYFVAVRGFGSSTGDYVLTVDCATPVGNVVQADFDIFGSGCPGSTGENLEVVPRFNDWPQIGSDWAFDLRAPGATAGFVLVGLLTFDPALDLGVLGAPGCELWVNPAVVLPLATSAPGEFEWVLPIPADPIHVSGGMLIQALALDDGANDLGLTSSNRLVVLIGNDG